MERIAPFPPVPALVARDPAALLPVIVQDDTSREVLMLAYMNAAAYQKTVETGETWFWSRERNALWHKGETSGNVQRVREIRLDCDGDTLLALVEQTGTGACHRGTKTCFDPAPAH